MIAVNNTRVKTHGMQLWYQSNSGTNIKHDIVDTKSETICIVSCIYKGAFAGSYSSNSLEPKPFSVHSKLKQLKVPICRKWLLLEVVQQDSEKTANVWIRKVLQLWENFIAIN